VSGQLRNGPDRRAAHRKVRAEGVAQDVDAAGERQPSAGLSSLHPASQRPGGDELIIASTYPGSCVPGVCFSAMYFFAAATRCSTGNARLYFVRWLGCFQPMTDSALHSAVLSLGMKKSARALTFAGRARVVGVTKYKLPSGIRQSVNIGSSSLSGKYCVAMNSGSSVMARPARTVGNNASTLVPRKTPVGVTEHSAPFL